MNRHAADWAIYISLPEAIFVIVLTWISVSVVCFLRNDNVRTSLPYVVDGETIREGGLSRIEPVLLWFRCGAAKGRFHDMRIGLMQMFSWFGNQ